MTCARPAVASEDDGIEDGEGCARRANGGGTDAASMIESSMI